MTTADALPEDLPSLRATALALIAERDELLRRVERMRHIIRQFQRAQYGYLQCDVIMRELNEHISCLMLVFLCKIRQGFREDAHGPVDEHYDQLLLRKQPPN